MTLTIIIGTPSNNPAGFEAAARARDLEIGEAVKFNAETWSAHRECAERNKGVINARRLPIGTILRSPAFLSS
jgi:hypothetical protein